MPSANSKGWKSRCSSFFTRLSGCVAIVCLSVLSVWLESKNQIRNQVCTKEKILSMLKMSKSKISAGGAISGKFWDGSDKK